MESCSSRVIQLKGKYDHRLSVLSLKLALYSVWKYTWVYRSLCSLWRGTTNFGSKNFCTPLYIDARYRKREKKPVAYRVGSSEARYLQQVSILYGFEACAEIS